MNHKSCVHHWRIDNRDIGTCIHCGEVKNFRRLQGKEGWKQREGLVARSSKPPLLSREAASEGTLVIIDGIEKLLKIKGGAQ
ncbi:hypothetical protein ES708_33120 [subsurface metagenome]